MPRTILFFVIFWGGELSHVLAEIHVGAFCTKHEDCTRYCAYSKFGPEGTSCCFPEKIRVSKSTWLSTGSNTCYCCPANSLSKGTTTVGGNVLVTPISIGLVRNNSSEHQQDPCLGYLNTNSEIPDDVTNDFCQSGKCIQAMVIMKMTFEYPSVCRAKKFPLKQ